MALIRKPAELKVAETVKILIYGQAGLGKTTLGLSAPAPLLIDTDGGVHRVESRFIGDTVQVSNYADILDVLAQDLRDYKTLVFDTVGKLLDYMSGYIIQNDPRQGRADGSLTLQGYGARKMLFQGLLRTAATLGKNLVFIAHDREERGADDITVIRPEIGGSSGGDLIKELDIVGYMEALGSRRTISFNPCQRYYAKNTFGAVGVQEVPDLTNAPITANRYLSDVIMLYSEKQVERLKIVAEYSGLMDAISGAVDECADADGINEVTAWAKQLTTIWDSKLRASRLIAEKAAALGLTFDREVGKYVQPTTLPEGA